MFSMYRTICLVCSSTRPRHLETAVSTYLYWHSHERGTVATIPSMPIIRVETGSACGAWGKATRIESRVGSIRQVN